MSADIFSIATAQTKPKRGDIEANLDNHYKMIELVCERGANLILFTEMSTTCHQPFFSYIKP